MAKLVSIGPLGRFVGRSRERSGSRWMFVRYGTAAGAAVDGLAITGGMGNKFWLLEVKIYLGLKQGATDGAGLLWLTHGLREDAGIEEVINVWGCVLGWEHLHARALYFSGMPLRYEFDCEQLFVGEKVRFAVASQITSTETNWIMAAFRISEVV